MNSLPPSKLLEQIKRIAIVEFSELVVQASFIGPKLRIFLADDSFIDVWVSRKLKDRFGFHWERRHLDGTIYRYDNFPDSYWRFVDTFPFHFHEGSQDNVVASPFSLNTVQGFRDFMHFVAQRLKISSEEGD